MTTDAETRRIIAPGLKAQETRERAGYYLGASFVLGSVGLGVLASPNGVYPLGALMLVASVFLLAMFGATWDLQHDRPGDAPVALGKRDRVHLGLCGLFLAGIAGLFVTSFAYPEYGASCIVAMFFLVMAINLLRDVKPSKER